MRIIVLFNLKPGADAAAYEEWTRTTDLPAVRALPSVLDFQAYRTTGLLMGEGEPAYRYVQVIDVGVMDDFRKDLDTEMVRKVAAEFERFADKPQFILTEALSEVSA